MYPDRLNACLRLVRPAAGSAPYRGVLSLAKQTRGTVGFLTDAAFAERADQGTLLVAVLANEVAGYCCTTCHATRSALCISSSLHRGVASASPANLSIGSRTTTASVAASCCIVAMTSPPTRLAQARLRASRRAARTQLRRQAADTVVPIVRAARPLYVSPRERHPARGHDGRLCVLRPSGSAAETCRATIARRLARRACAPRGDRPPKQRDPSWWRSERAQTSGCRTRAVPVDIPTPRSVARNFFPSNCSTGTHTRRARITTISPTRLSRSRAARPG